MKVEIIKPDTTELLFQDLAEGDPFIWDEVVGIQDVNLKIDTNRYMVLDNGRGEIVALDKKAIKEPVIGLKITSIKASCII